MQFEKLSPTTLRGANSGFLRAINVRFDATHPKRIAHYRPTAKSATLLESLAGLNDERAWLVVAPYGSGKSLAATYLLNLIENRVESAPVRSTIESRLKGVSPVLWAFARERRSHKEQRGLVVALHGYCPDLDRSLREAAVESLARIQCTDAIAALQRHPHSPGDISSSLAALTDIADGAGCDRILFLWDEFGRHLEGLVADGRPSTLLEVQVLAEYASRSSKIPLTLGLLLHQGLIHYATGMPESVRSEWRKVEGRFKTLQFVDDSKELYRLVADVVGDLPRYDAPTIDSKVAAEQCHAFGLFKDFTVDELGTLLEKAYPLEPTTLYLLPRIAARVAQNERTLFTFLYGADLHESIGPEVLFDYFSSSMQADTVVGGTYRHWLETQSALSKVSGANESAKALKTACLLSLGTGGERSRAGHDLLLFALRGYSKTNGFSSVIDHLIEQKLLLHRKHSNEVAVWHGTDVDLRGRLEEEKRRHRDHFDLMAFVRREVTLPVWRPVEYNDQFAVRRYLEGEFHNRDTLQAYLGFELPLQSLPIGCDGKVLSVIAETLSDLRAAEERLQSGLNNERLIATLPREPVALTEAALEVWCLQQMQLDSDLTGTDPLVVPELEQMTDDARGHMQRLIDRVVQPGLDGPRWFYMGTELAVTSSRDLRRALSRIMLQVFSQTPVINNEMIVRHQPSSVVINSRKKLTLGILERSGQPGLGIQGNFPDASMFRTVLLNTGLYRATSGDRWEYASPDQLADPGLKAVWSRFRGLMTEPADGPKDLRQFLADLMEPPYGVRDGVLPILFAAAMRAFPSALSLLRDGQYVSDILPSEIEQLCREPERFQLRILDLDDGRQAYLRNLTAVFADARQAGFTSSDLIRNTYDALMAWRAGLPPAALSTKRLSPKTQRFRDALQVPADPVRLLFDILPAALETTHILPETATAAAVCRDELAVVTDGYGVLAEAALRRLITAPRAAEASIRDLTSQWALCFPSSLGLSIGDGHAKGLLTRLGMTYGTDEQLLDSLSSLLVGKSIRRWDDGTVAQFERELETAIGRIEDKALQTDLSALGEEAVDGLAALVCGRMQMLYDQLVRLVGRERADAMMATQDAITRGNGTP